MKISYNWIHKLRSPMVNRKLIILAFLLVVGYLFYKRVGWDSGPSPLIQSDSQIKLYQTIEYKKRGINSHQCYSKFKDFDEDFKFYPFRYPWTYFTTSQSGQKTCVFQYPSFFAQSFSLLPIPYRFYNGIILILYLLLSFVVVLTIRSIFEIAKFEYLALAGFLYLVGYEISSAIEFSESIPSQILLLSFFYAVFHLESAKRPLPNLIIFSFGFFGGVSIFLRSESVIYIGVLGLTVLYFNRKQLVKFVEKYLTFVSGFALALVLFGYYNFHEFQEVLGVRSKVSYTDFSRLQIEDRIHLISKFFLGDTNRVGFLFYCTPIIILLIYGIFKIKLSQLQKLLVSVSIPTFFGVVLLSPYSSGGLYLGLRFTEFSYLLFCIFAISLLKTATNKKQLQVVLILIFLQIGFGFYHVRKNFKTLDFVKKYHDIFQVKLEKEPNAPVVHLSTFDLLLISDSFLKKPHWIVNKQSEFNLLESKFLNSGVNVFQVFVYDHKPPKDENVTDEFYKEWIDTKFEIDSKFYKKKSDEEIAGFRFMVWEKK
ncbi:LA_3751/LA_3752 family putative glycosyltransferase [Leptospira terpstrae]|nr:hypothetical protein [Leptospira terpstrae]